MRRHEFPTLRTTRQWHDEQRAARRRRLVVLGLALFALLVLFTMPPCTGAGGFDC